MNNRSLKDTLYEQVARIGKALSSPKRLELLELLAQGEKTVELLAAELSIDVKLTSAHLKALKDAPNWNGAWPNCRRKPRSSRTVEDLFA
jgi:DNA-binding transcriptional ArsR family regulator